MQEEKKAEDRRVRRTKRLFHEAFIQLLAEKEYHQITVTDIVHYADYNRTTFYLHYKYKEDLADEVIEHLLNELSDAFRYPFHGAHGSTCRKPSPAALLLFDLILEKRKFFHMWKNIKTIPHLEERLLATLKRLLKEYILLWQKTDDNKDIDWLVTFQAYGLLGIIKEWVESDFAAPPEYMAAQWLAILDFAAREELQPTV